MISVAKTTGARISTLRLVHHPDRPPLARRQLAVLPQPAEDVLDVDDGVVHQLADGDGHAAEGHGVDRHRPARSAPGSPSTSDSGIASSVRSARPQLPRKSTSTTITTSTPPSRNAT